MAKSQNSPQPDIDAVDAEVKDIMGPTPFEAKAHSVDDDEQNEIVGAPEVTGENDITPKVEEELDKAITAEKDNDTPIVPDPADSVVPKVDKSVSDEPEDPEVSAAVADIISKEGDEILAAEDALAEKSAVPLKQKKGIGKFFSAWWHNKKARNITFAVLAAILLLLALIPATRYAILNALGVRASLALQVIDSKNGIPIKNAAVSAGGQKGITGDDGRINLTGVELGKTNLEITKRSFKTINQTITVGWGSNPYNDPFQMTPTGSEYSFTVTDWLSGQPIVKAEVSDGESTAVTDETGKATLTIQPTDTDLQLTITAKDYRTEKLAMSSSDTADKPVKLVVAKPDVYVSKRSGKYDLYKRDADGSNETILVGGTGSEQDPLGLLVNSDGNTAAFVSTRDGKRDSNGYLLSNLFMVDVTTKTMTKVAGTESSQIQLIDWIGDTLVFVKIVPGPSAATVGRQLVLVYDSKQDKVTELASANYLNDVEVYKGQVYFAPASGGAAGSAAPQLVRINPDGSAKTVLLDKEVWATYRISYPKLLANASDNKWYEQNLGDSKMTVLVGAPASTAHRIYMDSPNGEKTVWVDNRDGKGVLILQDLKTPETPDKVVYSAGGLGYPIRWLSDKHILMRVSNSQETADYVINIDGGQAQKVGDVTNTAKTSRWYYY